MPDNQSRDEVPRSPGARAEREARALRANLRRRKQQAQAREAARSVERTAEADAARPDDETT